MKERELRRTMAVFPIGAVMKLTDLTARQIRYYEDQGLITPERTEGNRRMFSLNDMDRLLEIKDFISDGLHISDIKNEYMQRQHMSKEKQKSLSDAEVRRLLQDELRNQGRFSSPSQHIGNMHL
ncbi:MerR family transcriptional regulator [Streptococcus agalactiae]|uniref:MerR family transcriptional regulator n=1 Tax=Streptococcus agalactiae TaxID=1311 RepID=UPI001374FB71|nr:MerR family transcriptional regulator [Streptococcus agalactiae]KAF1102411.1 MerR family transcriptional regulator [Streptococcus agalactiae]KAF1199398.1 MerR family transcriptional regulator [Streptococcus agalactiae]KAF1217283.1 MerR family transcriptional regulator [Streptococcus agalactiae]MBU8846378.1 MerR family transcriptional regulator [Streptococcus agalactiae]MCD0066475.1 MerR family transcriptional regulator [Streptococcus agalactiae]